MTSSPLIRVLTVLVCLVIGAVYGAAGTIGQAATVWGLPVGLVVALIGIGALTLAVRMLIGDRWAALAIGVGALVTTILFSGTGPGGSVVVPAPAKGEISTGIVWTFAMPLIVAIIIAWPRIGARRPPADRSAPGAN